MYNRDYTPQPVRELISAYPWLLCTPWELRGRNGDHDSPCWLPGEHGTARIGLLWFTIDAWNEPKGRKAV